MTTARVARILAFGDSLTEGFVDGGMRMHPYAIKLRHLLGPNVHVHEAGVSGETATAMDSRLKGLIEQEQQKGTPFTHVLIMAGTNDLAWGIDGPYLVQVLSNLHRIAHDAGCKTLALSVPPASFALPRRDTANELLLEWANTNTNRVKFLNVGSFIPYDDAHKQYWDDNLHFSEAGYDYLGTLIYDAINDEAFLTPL